MSQLPFGCRNMTVRPCSARPCALKIPRTVGNCPNDKHVSTIARESTQRLRGWCYFISGMLVGTEMFWRRCERLDRRGGSAVWNRDFYLLVQITSNRLL